MPTDEITRSPRPYRNPAGSVVVKTLGPAWTGAPVTGRGLFTAYQSPEQRADSVDANPDPILSPAR